MQNSITKSYRMMDELGWGGVGNVWYYKRKAGGGGCDYPHSPSQVICSTWNIFTIILYI